MCKTLCIFRCVEDVVAEKKHENEQLGIKDRVWQEYAEFKVFFLIKFV